jgi:hypothetical protein
MLRGAVGVAVRIRFGVAAMLVVALLSWPASSPALVTIGANLSQPLKNSAFCISQPCTQIERLPQGTEQIAAPATGTIISWGYRSVANTMGSVFALRIVRPVGADVFIGAGTSVQTTVPDNAEAIRGPVPTGLPIQAGDLIGLDEISGGSKAASAFAGGNCLEAHGLTSIFNSPDLAEGGAGRTPEDTICGELLLNATEYVVPLTSATPPPCSTTPSLAVKVTPDTAATTAIAHYRLDGGPEQAVLASGTPPVATIPVPSGTHTIEYWGEESFKLLGTTLAQQEPQHHSAGLLVDATPPVVTITSDQGTTTYPVGALASIGVAASDVGTGLALDPSGHRELLPTARPGTFTVTRTASDRCGNSTTARFTYTVSARPTLEALKLTPKAFVAAPSGPSVARRRYGTTVSYRDSEAATATFTVLETRRGFRRGGRCLAPRRRPTPHRIKPCRRSIAIGSFIHHDRAGGNRFSFRGTLFGHPLKRGRYTLRVTATVGELTSTALKASFRVKVPARTH